jgi:hypothetical protein
LAKLTGRPDPVNVIFGGLLEQYLAYGKKKTGEEKAHSSRNTEGRNASLHLNHWAERVAKAIEPLEIQRWLDKKTQDLRSKLRSMMSAVYNHGQKFGMIPRREECNPMRR